MVHVTFNEKVECHQYSSAHTETQPNNRHDDKNDATNAVPSSVGGKLPPRYTAEFLKGLRYGPHTQTCPVALINSGLRKDAVEPFSSRFKSVHSRLSTYLPNSSNFSKKNLFWSTFLKQTRKFITGGQRQRPLTSYYSTYNQPNGGRNRDNGSNPPWMFQPIEPIGTSQYTSRHMATNTMQEFRDNIGYNRNSTSEFGHRRQNAKSSSNSKYLNDENNKPEWYSNGPTSQTDCIELHGFEGPEMPEHHEHHSRNDQLGCVDCNVSGGPTSGTSSNNGSPPAKSTPAKVTFNGKIHN